MAAWLSVTAAFTLLGSRQQGQPFLLDTAIYRLGAQAIRDRTPLYGATATAPAHLPFTYPPFAAIFFRPLASMSAHAAGIAMDVAATLCLCGALAVVGWALGRQVGSRGDIRRLVPLAVAAGAVPVAFSLQPVALTLLLGQINTVLLLMVCADQLVPARWWPRGVLTGVAAAVKLTPLAGVIVFAGRRDWRGLLTMLATFVVAGAAAWAYRPADSRAYWNSGLFDTSHAGEVWWKGNSCWRAVLARTSLTAPEQTAWWIVLSLLTAAVGLVAVHRATRAGDDVCAVLVGGAVQLLVSPVSWLHHWVWFAPALLWLAVKVWRDRSIVAAVALPIVTAFVFVGPGLLVPGSLSEDVPWTWWQQIVGNGYVLIAVVFLVVVASVGLRTVAPSPGYSLRPHTTQGLPPGPRNRPSVRIHRDADRGDSLDQKTAPGWWSSPGA